MICPEWHNLCLSMGMRKTLSITRESLMGWTRVTESGCWEWTRGHFADGYGAIRFDGGMRKVHRVAYELFVGPIPDGHHVHHDCKNPPCWNPAHMKALDPRSHVLVGDTIARHHQEKT